MPRFLALTTVSALLALFANPSFSAPLASSKNDTATADALDFAASQFSKSKWFVTGFLAPNFSQPDLQTASTAASVHVRDWQSLIVANGFRVSVVDSKGKRTRMQGEQAMLPRDVTQVELLPPPLISEETKKDLVGDPAVKAILFSKVDFTGEARVVRLANGTATVSSVNGEPLTLKMFTTKSVFLQSQKIRLDTGNGCNNTEEIKVSTRDVSKNIRAVCDVTA
jgi:hypothetical protein